MEQQDSLSGKELMEDTPSLKFQKFKYRIDLIKWFIGSVVLVVVTLIIDWGFRDRAASVNELKLYDRYVTELIVLNQNPVQKRMLAQFFAAVTPSEKLKKGWQTYFEIVDKEYQAYVRPILHEDSLLQIQYNALITTDKPADTTLRELDRISAKLEQNRKLLHPEIRLPEGGE